MLDAARVQKELVECNKDCHISGISVDLHRDGSSLYHLTGTISGPLDTPYEGGAFEIDIVLSGTCCFFLPFPI